MEITKAQYELKKVLQLKFAELQAKNPQYSLRAFAKSLDIHAASLSEFFADKRQFSPKLQKKIIDKLNIAPDRKQRLMEVVDHHADTPADAERIQIDTDSYHMVVDPIYYSILCLLETKNFEEDYAFMARRLKRKSKEIKEAMERLERVGYIKRVGKKLMVAEAHLMTTDDIANMSLRLRHAENLDSAKNALLNLDVDKRYFRFETLAISTEDMPEFKKAASEFFSKLVLISQKSKNKNEVYEFCFNFFPRTELNSK
jgi:uncharacterized protein (TIGR02147 family)